MNCEINANSLWSQQQLSAVYQSIANSNSLLLSGEIDSGRSILIKQIVQFIICTNGDKQICNACNDCLLFKHNTHPDILFLDEPNNTNTTIKIEKIRELISFTQTKPNNAKYKIAVLFNANTLNFSGMNAILKVLEEPSGDAKIILGSFKPILATITSRCRKIPVPLATLATKYLNSLESVDEKELLQLLAITDNLPLRAINYQQQNALGFAKAIISSKTSIDWHNNLKKASITLLLELILIILADALKHLLYNANLQLTILDDEWEKKLSTTTNAKIFQALTNFNLINKQINIQQNLNQVASIQQLSAVWFNIW